MLTFPSQRMRDLVQQGNDFVAGLLQPRCNALNLSMTIMDVSLQPLVKPPQIRDDFTLLLQSSELTRSVVLWQTIRINIGTSTRYQDIPAEAR